ncbi:ABC transporter [Virgisporangium aliadipatigenens]|uniref:ABC transporter n=1 Tax=Virgisporangium aliadipatigenens TaxID=741659 RepID=A0A8J3YL17_9ACTN|nr:ABC transporter permease subunit [Virgisporangium aliadipatigenens]GIJ46068.1 ABC transporter [Virgisporangium aliadipatigenens]
MNALAVLRAEWTKFRTAPGMAWLLVGVAVATAGLSAWASGVSGGAVPDPVRVSLTGVMFGQAVVAIVAVLPVGDEYASGMVRVSFAAVPRRWAVLGAKALVVGGAVAVAAVPGVLVSLWAGQRWLSGYAGGLWRPGVGALLYLVLVGLLSVGVAAVLRNSAAAIGAVLGLLFAFPLMALSVPDPDWRRHIEQVGPMSAGMSVLATRGLDELPIAPWRGLGVLAAWALGFLLVGVLLTERRDS